MRLVIDASVAIKWFVEEEASQNNANVITADRRMKERASKFPLPGEIIELVSL